METILLPILLHATMVSIQQTTAAQNIVNAYQIGTYYAVLISQCQAGKTGTYNKIIEMMLTSGMVQRVYILCGSSETILRNQAIADVIHYNKHLFENGFIKIIFHQDFKKSTMITENALIIVDESHLVQTKGQKLDLFLMRHGITMDGNPANLALKKTYILSVDATPYSELAALHHKETPFHKHVEKLQPGSGYRGLKAFQDEGLFHPIYSISKNPEKFRALLESFESKRKYLIMRMYNSSVDSTESEQTIIQLCKDLAIPVLYYTHNNKQIALNKSDMNELGGGPCLDSAEPPSKTTVVIVRGMLRAGKVVPKQHIGFVWENSKSANADTLNQGLIGRMCGYHDFKIQLFVPEEYLKQLTVERLDGEEQSGRYTIKQSELDRSIAVYNAAYNVPPTKDGQQRRIHQPLFLPRSGMNLMPGTVLKAPHDKYYGVPLRVSWDGTQVEDLLGD